MRTQAKGKEHKFCPREPRARIDANLRRLDSAGFCRSATLLVCTVCTPAGLRLSNPARRVFELGCRTQGEDAEKARPGSCECALAVTCSNPRNHRLHTNSRIRPHTALRAQRPGCPCAVERSNRRPAAALERRSTRPSSRGAARVWRRAQM